MDSFIQNAFGEIQFTLQPLKDSAHKDHPHKEFYSLLNRSLPPILTSLPASDSWERFKPIHDTTLRFAILFLVLSGEKELVATIFSRQRNIHT